MLFVALGTLVLTPQLLKIGLRWAGTEPTEQREIPSAYAEREPPIGQAVVVGAGPVGARVASHLETTGWDVCLVDFSPVNLHPFAQAGFRTVAGDAVDADILRHAGAARCHLAVMTVPDDAVAAAAVTALRALNPRCRILVRCRYQANVRAIQRAGAELIVSEETEAAGALLRSLERTAGRPEDQAKRS
jgi:CPA2 family monovalent cation:H+ antiporter-2